MVYKERQVVFNYSADPQKACDYAPIIEGAMKEVLAIMKRKQEALRAGESFNEEAEIQKHFDEKRKALRGMQWKR